jgi:hypothetical protein
VVQRPCSWLFAVSLDGGPNEDVLQVFELVLKLGIFEHDVFEISLSNVLRESELVVLLPDPLQFVLEFLQ